MRFLRFCLSTPASDALDVGKAHDARDAKAPPAFEVKAPKEAPVVPAAYANEEESRFTGKIVKVTITLK